MLPASKGDTKSRFLMDANAPGWVEQLEERAVQDPLLAASSLNSSPHPCFASPQRSPASSTLVPLLIPELNVCSRVAAALTSFLDPFQLVFGADITFPAVNSCSSLGLTFDSVLSAVSWLLGTLPSAPGRSHTGRNFCDFRDSSLFCHLLSFRILKGSWTPFIGILTADSALSL